MRITELSDEALLASLDVALLEGHAVIARIVTCLVEIEERRLHLKAACTSMFDYCVRKLRMSEGAAFRRLNAARLVRRFPSLLERVGCGEVCLSTLVLLRPHLTAENLDELIAEASGKTQREIELLLAKRAPKPDVPTSIVELRSEPIEASLPLAEAAEDSASSLPPKPTPSRVVPLSETRFKVQLTASAELKAKLERAQDLMRHRNPSGDLAVVLDAAMDVLLERLERERLAKTSRPRQTTRHAEVTSTDADSDRAKARSIPRAVRREVFARDGEQCAFVNESGERCPSRGFLELDHVQSRALGGSDAASNLRVLCRAHNRLHAEEVFGKAHVASRIDLAIRGLSGMGFRKKEAERAMHVVARNHTEGLARLGAESLVREALRVLT
jgi:5-methylcytosine-specific restriction endonuclease McrA